MKGRLHGMVMHECDGVLKRAKKKMKKAIAAGF
jgi:hypothetical protein